MKVFYFLLFSSLSLSLSPSLSFSFYSSSSFSLPPPLFSSSSSNPPPSSSLSLSPPLPPLFPPPPSSSSSSFSSFFSLLFLHLLFFCYHLAISLIQRYESLYEFPPSVFQSNSHESTHLLFPLLCSPSRLSFFLILFTLQCLPFSLLLCSNGQHFPEESKISTQRHKESVPGSIFICGQIWLPSTFKSIIMGPAWFLFLRIALAILGLFWFS